MKRTGLKRICVFAGSSPGTRPEYRDAAASLGAFLASRQIAVVYGGARVGLMGALADAALSNGGQVIGVIPHALMKKEIAHDRLSELKVVRSMHERKQTMADLADGFIALPGGVGTLEEFVEVMTWAQLGLHLKPCGLFNVADYFAQLLAFLDHAVAERFLPAHHRAMLVIEKTPEALIDRFGSYQPPRVEKWLDREES